MESPAESSRSEKVTTPYCSGLSLLRVSSPPEGAGFFCNHPLLFGTVSPTREGFSHVLHREYRVTTPYCSGLSLLQIVFARERDFNHIFCNHPLLFGTVSPTWNEGESVEDINL